MIFTDQNFKQEIEEKKELTLVDFFAEWCGPCKLMGPVIDELIQEYKDKNVKIGKLNVDENAKTAEKYGIMSIPTFVLFKDGKAIEQLMGFQSKEALRQIIEKNL